MYCDSLFSRNEVASFCRSGDVVLIGNGYPNYNFPSPPDSQVLEFDRCIFSKTVFHSAQYDRPLKTDDTVFRLKNKKFVQVLHILYCDGIALSEVVYLNVNKVIMTCIEQKASLPTIDHVEINHLFKVEDRKYKDIIRVTDLNEKCVHLELDDVTYLCTLPNFFEIQ